MKYSRLIVVSILLLSLFYVNQSANGAVPLRRTASFLKTRVFQRRANVRSLRFHARCEIQEAERACRVKSLLDRGVSLCEQGKSDDALDMFNEAIRLDPANAEAYVLRGSWHFHYDDYEKAVSDCNKAIEINPESSLAFSLRGAAYIGKCDYAKSLNDLSKAIRLDPKRAGAYSNRAHVHFIQKDVTVHGFTAAARGRAAM